MSTASIRRRLHEQIDRLPDELVRQVADFALFLDAKQRSNPRYEEWDERHWHEFALQQFFRKKAEDEEGEIEYTLKDAREVYHT